MENKVKFEISNSTIIKIILAIFAVWLIYAVREVVVLFFIVLVIVAALGPLVERMAKYIPRALAVIILGILFLGLLTAIGFLMIPPIVEQLKQLAVNLPIILDRLGPIYQHLQNSISNYQESLFNASSQIGRFSSGVYSTTVGFFSAIVAFFTIIVLSFYMLLEGNMIKALIHQFIPEEHKANSFNIAEKINQKMGSWLRGQATLMVIIGTLDGIALAILGVPYALTLAVWGGLTEVIPYVGPWLGLIPAFIIAFTVSPLTGLLVLIVYVVIQQAEAQFLVPKIMGRAVGLSPVIIILSLLIGAKLMGILGVVIAVPIAAAISVLIQEWPEIKKLRS
ncbi:MAG: hypothetical protein US94_C0031G0004 [Berkelbacteria bacterium GW2011_GWB1_38_5]|uniref:AI-2E family transporter n=1 Tax=Berkelbacteria bacterium GW2011_GWB1_38_5 TaxID=1618336 RepID=A0A0G0K4A7_9BACT|nr:MAG: hypothetical protein US94_C0031G0004 [Berkelbacteria bacterium GW2011_GWB1_38_5]